MLYNFLVENIPLAIFCTIGIFAFVKLITVKTTHLPDSTHLFVESFGLYSEQYIRNTFHKNLKKYYKSSNKINALFYLFLAVMVGLYFFIKVL